MPTRAKYLLKVKVEGPGVRSKSITIPDLLKICETLQTAINRQAETIRGGVSLRPGPKTQEVYTECTLELCKMGSGSTTLSFRLAKPQQPLPISDIQGFGEEVVSNVIKAIKSFETKRTADKSEVDPGVVDSLKNLGEIFEKRNVSKIRLTVPSRNGRPRIQADFTKASRNRVISRIRVPSHREITIEGTLEMGDFRQIDRRCRVRPPVGPTFYCTFDESQEEQIYEALRRPVRIIGKATINPNTQRVEEVYIQKVSIIEAYLIGVKEFHAGKSIAELADAQGIKPLSSTDVLKGGWPDEYDLDEFLADVYAGRTL